MTRPPRDKVRPIAQNAIGEKRFKPVIERLKRVKMGAVHPLVVIMDLRRGFIASLGRYLAQQGGIPDREVALELRKLIAGSAARTPYRLVVVEHPENPKDQGGRPTTAGRKPTDKEFAVARSLREKARRGQVKRVVGMVAAKFEIGESTVHLYNKRVADYERACAVAEAASLAHKERLADVRVRRAKALLSLENDNILVDDDGSTKT